MSNGEVRLCEHVERQAARPCQLENRSRFESSEGGVSFCATAQNTEYGIETAATRKEGESPVLLLSRKEGEEIVIGGDTVITITRIGSSRVTVGIEAPSEVSIVRGELDPLPEILPVMSAAVAS